MTQKNKKITIQAFEAGERIDKFLALYFSSYSRNYFSQLIEKEAILVNDKNTKPKYMLKTGDEINITFEEKAADKKLAEISIQLDIIFSNPDVLVINKPAGLVVHPAAGHTDDTLVNAIIKHFPEIKKAVYDKDNLISRQRPGLVHRLDKDTSGVLIVAKTAKALHFLSRQIHNRHVKKTYYALCYGWPKEAQGKLVNHLGRHPKNRKLIADIGPDHGKEAISEYKVIKYLTDSKNDKASLIEFDIQTGRTHQIRVQASKIGHPVLGDAFYGNKNSEKISDRLGANRQMLHAKELQIRLPGESKLTTFSADLPEDFKLVLSKLKEYKL